MVCNVQMQVVRSLVLCHCLLVLFSSTGCVSTAKPVGLDIAAVEQRGKPNNLTELTVVLQERWTLEMVRAVCTYQQPIPGGIAGWKGGRPRWEGVLYPGQDEIVVNWQVFEEPRSDWFIITARRGDRFWFIESGWIEDMWKPKAIPDLRKRHPLGADHLLELRRKSSI
jgi:hypothetical protein